MPHANGGVAPPRVAVIGAGYWGKNLVRNFHAAGALECVCELDESIRRRMAAELGVRTVSDVDEVYSDPRIDGVVIAAPAVLHADLAARALEHGKHGFVEKPLALSCSDGRELVKIAARAGLVLMVGHILEYHPALVELKRLISQGALGKIRYIHSSRLNLGKLRTEENILWSFAPHDISAILHLLDEAPVRVSAQGGSYLNPSIVDTTLSTLDFDSGVKAHIFVSWLHPFKEQKMCVIGSEKMAVFDDLEAEKKLVLYAHRINWLDRKPVAERDGGQVIPLVKEEPLRRECQHFLDCIHTGQTPRTDGARALRVLEVLDACERSLRDGGTPARIVESAPSHFAHATAAIDQPCEIGAGTRIWHFSHVMKGAAIGAGCNIGQNVVVSSGVTIGNNVKIQNNVSVYTGVELEDDVFCGPSMVFTNVVNPRSHVSRRNEYQRTLVRRGATLGANSTIVCGVTIGRYAFIAAGAVVTHDVPDYALVLGVPARRAGWMCACGVRLPDATEIPVCAACGKSYEVGETRCVEVDDHAAAPALVSTAGSGQ